MLIAILLTVFCLYLAQSLTTMNENPRIVVANLSETFVRLNWTQAQDLLADTLKVKCRGSREYINSKGVLAMDKIVRTHYYSLDTTFSSTGLFGDLKPNMQFACVVNVYYQDRKISSAKMNFSTAVTAPESPHEPTVRAGSIPGDYTVHLYKTSTRHSPVSGYEVQFHMVDDVAISNDRPMIHKDQFRPFGSLITIDKARESLEPASFCIRNEFPSPKLAIIRSDLLQGALKKGSSYSVVTVAFYDDESLGRLYSHSSPSSIISIPLKDPLPRPTTQNSHTGSDGKRTSAGSFRSRFGRMLWFMGTAAFPVLAVLIALGILVLCCKMKRKLFSRKKHNFRRPVTTKKTLYYLPRPNPLAKVTPTHSRTHGYEMVSTQPNPSPLSTSPATRNHLSNKDLHSTAHKEPSKKGFRLAHRHKKHSSNHTHQHKEVKSRSYAHHQRETSVGKNVYDHSTRHHEKLPKYAAQFPHHSTVRNTPQVDKNPTSPILEIDSLPLPLPPPPLPPPPPPLPPPPTSWPPKYLVVEAEVHSVPQQNSYSFQGTDEICISQAATRPPTALIDITDTVMPPSTNLQEGNTAQSDNALSVSSQYDTPPHSMAYKQCTDSSSSLCSNNMVTPLTSPLYNKQHHSSDTQCLPSTTFVPSQGHNDLLSVPSRDQEHNESNHYSINQSLLSAPSHSDRSSHHSSLDSVVIDTASKQSVSKPHTWYSDVVHRPCAPLPAQNAFTPNLRSFFSTTVYPSVPMLRAVFNTSGRHRSLSFTGPPLSQAYSQCAGSPDYSQLDNSTATTADMETGARKRSGSMPLLQRERESKELLRYVNLPNDLIYDDEGNRSAFRHNVEMQARHDTSVSQPMLLSERIYPNPTKGSGVDNSKSCPLPKQSSPLFNLDQNDPAQPTALPDPAWPNSPLPDTTPVVSPPPLKPRTVFFTPEQHQCSAKVHLERPVPKQRTIFFTFNQLNPQLATTSPTQDTSAAPIHTEQRPLLSPPPPLTPADGSISASYSTCSQCSTEDSSLRDNST